MSELTFDWNKVKLTKKFLNEKFYNNLNFTTIALINNKIDIVKKCLKKDPATFEHITDDVLINLAKLSHFTLLLDYFNILTPTQLKHVFNNTSDNIAFYFFDLATDTDIIKLLKFDKYILFDLVIKSWYILRIYLSRNYKNITNTKILEKIILHSKKFILKSRYIINPIIDGCLQGYNKTVLDLLYKHYPHSLSDQDEMLRTPLISSIVLNNDNLSTYLLEHDIDINYYGTQHAIITAITYQNNKIISLLLDKNVDVNVHNTQKWYCGHLILYKDNNITMENKKRILEKTTDFNVQNVNGSTILHLICAIDDLKTYKNILKKKKLVLDIPDIWDKSPVHYCSDIPLLKSITKQNMLIDKLLLKTCIVNVSDIKKPTLQHYSLFTGTQHDSLIYFTYYVQKFNINVLKSKKMYNVIEKYNDGEIERIINIYKKNMLIKNIFQYTNIIWYNNENYCYSKNLVSMLKNCKGITFIYATMVQYEYDHANCLIIDHNLKRIVHFEPYGVVDGKRFNDFDTHMKKLFKPLNYTYFAPKDYLSQVSFQALSNGYDKMSEQLGDIGGFCLAWTLWFLELYVNNQNTKNLKELINKSTTKIIYTKYSFLQYIRSYAHKLSIAKRDILLSINVPEEIIYKVNKSNMDIEYIMDGLSNLLS